MVSDPFFRSSYSLGRLVMLFSLWKITFKAEWGIVTDNSFHWIAFVTLVVLKKTLVFCCTCWVMYLFSLFSMADLPFEKWELEMGNSRSFLWELLLFSCYLCGWMGEKWAIGHFLAGVGTGTTHLFLPLTVFIFTLPEERRCCYQVSQT